MSYASTSITNREGQSKFAQSRVTAVEKYYGLFCETLGSFIRKSARLRDKGDIFAHHVKEYAEAEKLNKSTKMGLLSFAENFSTVQDYRDTEVHRLEAKVLNPLKKYGELCKNMKSSAKGNMTAWDREKKQMAKLQKQHKKYPTSSPQVTKAQTDLERLQQETCVYGEQLVAEADQFERNKLTDIKDVLIEFVQIEMMFHAKALKYLSNCYEAAQRIDNEEDMNEFRTALLEASGLDRTFNQTASLTSTDYSSNLASGTHSSSRGSNISSAYPQPAPRMRIQGNMYGEDSDEDDDEHDY